MIRKFDDEIQNLKESIIKMATLVDEQVTNALIAMEKNDPEYCKGIKGKDKEIDAYDNLIQAQCENILALYQPVAIDLRLVMTAIMINNQLERCGDIAVNISQRVKKTASKSNLFSESGLLAMGKNAGLLVKDAIDAFINGDAELAKNVIRRDDEVDILNKELFNFLVQKMKSDPELIELCAHLLVLTRHIERLADHATNIAEEIIFLLEAQIVAHTKQYKKHINET
jgi:phosphate transport system protein